MSGYNCKLILEIKDGATNRHSVTYVVECLLASINRHLESKGVKVSESVVRRNADHFELTFLDEYPIMSFNIFYEEEGGAARYISIIDLVKASTELMLSSDFFNELIESTRCKVDVAQAVLLLDPEYKSYGQLFTDLKLGNQDYNICASFQDSSE